MGFSGQHGHTVRVEFRSIGLHQLLNWPLGGNAKLFIVFDLLAIDYKFGRSCHGLLLNHQRIKERLHGVKILLPNWIEHVVVAFGTAYGHSHEGRGYRFDSGNLEFAQIFAIAVYGASRKETESEHVIRPAIEPRPPPHGLHCCAFGSSIAR